MPRYSISPSHNYSFVLSFLVWSGCGNAIKLIYLPAVNPLPVSGLSSCGSWIGSYFQALQNGKYKIDYDVAGILIVRPRSCYCATWAINIASTHSIRLYWAIGIGLTSKKALKGKSREVT